MPEKGRSKPPGEKLKGPGRNSDSSLMKTTDKEARDKTTSSDVFHRSRNNMHGLSRRSSLVLVSKKAARSKRHHHLDSAAGGGRVESASMENQRFDPADLDLSRSDVWGSTPASRLSQAGETYFERNYRDMLAPDLVPNDPVGDDDDDGDDQDGDVTCDCGDCDGSLPEEVKFHPYPAEYEGMYMMTSQSADSSSITSSTTAAGPKLDQSSSGSTGSMVQYEVESETLPPAAFRRPRNSDVINPVIDGIRQYGLNKGGISRAVVKFRCAPEPRPMTLCFHFPSTFLTHRYVLDMVRQSLAGLEGVSVTAIQFIDRNTKHGTQGMDNRWLVTVNMAEAKRMLLEHGLHLFNRRIKVRAYDDILAEEYNEYTQYVEAQKKLFAKCQELFTMTTIAEGDT